MPRTVQMTRLRNVDKVHPMKVNRDIHRSYALVLTLRDGNIRFASTSRRPVDRGKIYSLTMQSETGQSIALSPRTRNMHKYSNLTPWSALSNSMTDSSDAVPASGIRTASSSSRSFAHDPHAESNSQHGSSTWLEQLTETAADSPANLASLFESPNSMDDQKSNVKNQAGRPR